MRYILQEAEEGANLSNDEGAVTLLKNWLSRVIEGADAALSASNTAPL